MATFEVDVQEIQKAAEEIRKLSDGFDTEFTVADCGSGVSSGPGTEKLQQLCDAVKAAKEALSELMNATVGFLEHTAQSFSTSDSNEAAKIKEATGRC